MTEPDRGRRHTEINRLRLSGPLAWPAVTAAPGRRDALRGTVRPGGRIPSGFPRDGSYGPRCLEERLDLDAARGQRRGDPLGVRQLYPRVVAPVGDEQGRLDLVGVLERRSRRERFAVGRRVAGHVCSIARTFCACAVREVFRAFRWQTIGHQHAERAALRQSRAAHRIGENDAWQVAVAECMDAVIVGHDSRAFSRLSDGYEDHRRP